MRGGTDVGAAGVGAEGMGVAGVDEAGMDEAGVRALLESEGLTAETWGNRPLERYGEHRHAYDKVLVCAAGSIAFRLRELGRDVALVAGDRLELPAGTLHGADVGEDGVTCLEALPAGSLGDEPQHVPGWASRARASGLPG
jgi:quercetin dioxygenase-like cupin family protein